jgi:hypothetical protein
MRFLVIVCVVLVAGCASTGGAREFSTGQVWRLKDPRFGNGSVTIGAIESRGSRKVVHISVSGLPGPPTNLPLFIAMQRENPRLPEGEPLHFSASGLADAEGKWSPLSADFTIPVDEPNTTISIPHLVVYEERLREGVSVLERSGPPLNAMFDMNLQLWHDTEVRWPEMNDGSLDQPVMKQLDAVLHSASNLASDQRMATQMGPPPPAVAEAGEVAVDDPALDQRCREIVSPKPLDPKFIAELLKQGFKQDEIPEINVTLTNAVVTRSEKWGYVWRADVHDNNAPTNEGMGRSVCWRKTSDEQPAVTSYPLPDVPH